MSLSDRIFSAPVLSERRVQIGDPTPTPRLVIDPRPQTVKDAEQRHAQRITALNTRHQEALETAYRNGYNDGATLARDEAQSEVKRATDIVSSFRAEVLRTRTEWCRVYEEQMVALVCHALERILGDRPPVAERVLHALRRAFACLGEGDRITVRCHPDDMEFVRQAVESPAGEDIATRRIQVVADDMVQSGGCLLETDLGIVDARVEQQLRILRGTLMEAATAAGAEGDASPASR